MVRHTDITDKALREQIKQCTVLFSGNIKLKIYGTLNCGSGKRMKRENRIFFESSNEAILEDYRPCGNCMKTEYRKWIYFDKR